MIQIKKCECRYQEISPPHNDLEVYQIITDIDYLEGSFIMEYVQTNYTPEDILETLSKDVTDGNIERLKGYVYFKDKLSESTPQGRFLLQLSRDIKLNEFFKWN